MSLYLVWSILLGSGSVDILEKGLAAAALEAPRTGYV